MGCVSGKLGMVVTQWHGVSQTGANHGEGGAHLASQPRVGAHGARGNDLMNGSQLETAQEKFPSDLSAKESFVFSEEQVCLSSEP